MFTQHVYANRERFQIHTFVVIVLFHVLALSLAPFTFTWQGLVAFLLLQFMTGCFGITMGYHRLMTDLSFKATNPLKYFLAFCAALSLQGGPLYWVAVHRIHHKESDKEMDPHSPGVSFLWSHLLWNFYLHPSLETHEGQVRAARDIAEDPGYQFFEKYFFFIWLAVTALMYGAGYYFGGVKLGLSLVVWGCLLRTVYVWHVTWLVNSATHLWGYRTYESGDTSRNNWWVGLLAFGEGWHNNHHADQRCAQAGHQWWEFDITFIFLKLFEKLGWVHDLAKPSKALKRFEIKQNPLPVMPVQPKPLQS